MIFSKEGFPAIIDDNEVAYYNMIQTMIESADCSALGHLIKTPEAVIVRITPSNINLYKIVLQTIKEINTMFGLTVEFSKSITTSKNIVYKIKIERSQ